MTHFYNYDTRGASAASQIITMERMLQERDATIERLERENTALKAAIRQLLYWDNGKSEFAEARALLEKHHE